MIFRPTADPAQWRWLPRWLRQCTPRTLPAQSRADAAARALQPRAAAPAARRHRHRRPGHPRLPAAVPQRSRRGDECSRRARCWTNRASPTGCSTRPQTRALEPALLAGTPLAGALHLPDDESANCQLFCQLLAERAVARGVEFRHGVEIVAMRRDGNRVRGLLLARRRIAEPNTTACRRGRGLRRRGQRAAAAQARDRGADLSGQGLLGDHRPGPRAASAAGVAPRLPSMAVMDEAYKTAITPLGHGCALPARPNSAATAAASPFGAGTLRGRDDWFGPRSTSRHGAVLGRRAADDARRAAAARADRSSTGCCVNIGHGSTGWTMSCGSARVAGRAGER